MSIEIKQQIDWLLYKAKYVTADRVEFWDHKGTPIQKAHDEKAFTEFYKEHFRQQFIGVFMSQFTQETKLLTA